MNPQIAQIGTDLIRGKDAESHAVIGAAMEVHPAYSMSDWSLANLH
jgi:hypothetical protein